MRKSLTKTTFCNHFYIDTLSLLCTHRHDTSAKNNIFYFNVVRGSDLRSVRMEVGEGKTGDWQVWKDGYDEKLAVPRNAIRRERTRKKRKERRH